MIYSYIIYIYIFVVIFLVRASYSLACVLAELWQLLIFMFLKCVFFSSFLSFKAINSIFCRNIDTCVMFNVSKFDQYPANSSKVMQFSIHVHRRMAGRQSNWCFPWLWQWICQNRLTNISLKKLGMLYIYMFVRSESFRPLLYIISVLWCSKVALPCNFVSFSIVFFVQFACSLVK